MSHPAVPPTTVQDHIEAVCAEAGLGVMVQIYSIITDREQVSDKAILSLTAADVEDAYRTYVARAVDLIENNLLDSL